MKSPRLFAMLVYLLFGSGIVLMVHCREGIQRVLRGGQPGPDGVHFHPPTGRETNRADLLDSLRDVHGADPGPAKDHHLNVFLNNNFFLLSTIILVVLSSRLATQMRFREFTPGSILPARTRN